MNIKCVLIALALVVAGSAFTAANAFAGQQSGDLDNAQAPARSFASQSGQHFDDSDIDMPLLPAANDDTRDSNPFQSTYSGPDSNRKGPELVHEAAPAPESGSYALTIASLLSVFMVARRRRDHR